VEDRHFGVRYFGISDTGSSKGQGVVAARIAKSRNMKKPKSRWRNSMVMEQGHIFRHFGIHLFLAIPKVPRTRGRGGHFALEIPEVMKHDISLEWDCGHTFRQFGIHISAIPGTRSQALDIESPKVTKRDIPSELGCGHGRSHGQSHRPLNFGISAFQSSGNRRVKKLDIRTPEITKPKIPFRKGSRSCLVAVWR
jgi:hypothetical protein